MKVYLNPNLIISQIEDEFYSIVNPFIKDGLKIANEEQFTILSSIKKYNTIDQISEITKYSKEDILMVCRIFEEKEIVSLNSPSFSKMTKWKSIKNINLWVHTTNDCNLRCSYCYIHTIGFENYFSKENIDVFCHKLIDTAEKRELESITLRLSGGEPLLKFTLWKPYLINLKEQLENINCKLQIRILSNLVTLNEDVISFVKENNYGIGVSLDGINGYQNKTRHFKDGRGSFEYVVKNIEKLKNNNIHFGLMTVVSNSNIDGLDTLTQFIIDNNIPSRFSFVSGEELNIDKLIEKLDICYDKFERAIDDGFEFSKTHKLCDLKFDNPYIQTCSNGINGGAVYTDGSIHFCHRHFGVETPLGTIFEENDILSIIQRKTYYENASNECALCKYLYICTSGCPLERNNGKDPHCKVYQVMIPKIYYLKGKEKLRKLKLLHANQQ